MSDLTRRRVLQAGVVAAVAASTATTAPPAHARPSLLPITHWQERFDSIWIDENWDTFLMNRATSQNSWLYYHLGYGLDGLVAMAEATQDRSYLDAGLGYIEAIIDSALPSSELPDERYHDDDFLGWVSKLAATLDLQTVLYESVFFRYVTRTLRVIRQQPTWYDDPGVRARFDRILAFTEVQMFDKWWTRQTTHPMGRGETQLYRERTHMASHWAYISLGLEGLTADPTRRARCRDVVDHINLALPNYPSSLRAQMVAHPDDATATFFSDRWGQTTPPGSDVSHGSHVISYLVESQELGDEWTKRDLCRLVRTFDRILWPAEDVHAGYLDGSPGAITIQRATEWAKLGRYSVRLQARLDTEHAPSVPADQGFLPMSYYGNCAKNIWLMNGGA